MQAFSQKTIEELGYYVYVYSDPDTKKPFYVGKGKGNRVFAHLTDSGENKKTKTIKDILEQGKQPLIEILVHGVDEETAFKVEVAAIDLIGIENLTNQQRGHETSTYGKIEVSLLEARYNCEELSLEDITDDVMLIKINKLYHNDMTPIELYEATRAYWRVNIEQASKVKYVFAVYYGMVLEVYEVAQWFPAFSTMMVQRINQEEKDRLSSRYEFVGRVADENIRKKYKDKSVAALYAKGEQNPIKYIMNN